MQYAFAATGLRKIADVLDGLAAITNATGILIKQHLEFPDSDFRLQLAWHPTTEDQPGYYTVELEET